MTEEKERELRDTEKQTDGETEAGKEKNADRSSSSLFRYFAIAMLVIGGVLTLYRIAADPQVRHLLWASLPQSVTLPSLPDGATAARIERLHEVLMRARAALLIYREAHGILPDILSDDVAADFWPQAERDAFREATGGGLLAIAAASQGTDTVRMVGIFGGALSGNRRLRKGIAAYSIRGEGPQPPFLRFDGGHYEGAEMSVYIPLDD